MLGLGTGEDYHGTSCMKERAQSHGRWDGKVGCHQMVEDPGFHIHSKSWHFVGHRNSVGSSMLLQPPWRHPALHWAIFAHPLTSANMTMVDIVWLAGHIPCCLASLVSAPFLSWSFQFFYQSRELPNILPMVLLQGVRFGLCPENESINRIRLL